MISSVHQLSARKYINAIRSISYLLFISLIILLNSFQTASAQEVNDRKWSVGFQAGVLYGNLPTVSATNTIVSRFNIENDFYLTAAFQAGYDVSEFESLHLTLGRGEFSVFTDYEFWPEILFKNQFYTANLSAQLDLRRFIEALPSRLDPYGSFGLGVMSSRYTANPLNTQSANQNDFSDEQSSDISFLITTGLGFDYLINSRISLFFQFNHHFLSSDIIDKNLAGEILRNDFIQTTNNWSTLTSGIRIKFGRAKKQPRPEPEREDFQIVSTINADDVSEMVNQISESDDTTEENMIKSDSTTVQTALVPIPSDSTSETQPSKEISNDENFISEEKTDTEINGMMGEYEDDLVIVTQPRYGLMGVAVEQISGSYSLNLHSFTNPDEADKTINRLNAEGYRVVTQSATIDGIDYLRVAVGQFESRTDARSAAENLPEPYRYRYFIIQI